MDKATVQITLIIWVILEIIIAGLVAYLYGTGYGISVLIVSSLAWLFVYTVFFKFKPNSNEDS
jgi:hypothetical protein